MRLRNKKTGEILQNFDGFTTFTTDWSSAKNLQYASLTKLNEEWEDYREPLIKDEKIRKAVRAWADSNGVKEVTYFKEDFGLRLMYHTISIDLYSNTGELEDYKHYTITELCGEGEE